MRRSHRTTLFSCLAWTGMLFESAVAADLPGSAWQGRTMGSDYMVRIVDGKLGEAQVAALKAEIEATLVEVNRQMSNYQPDSELSRFNRAPVNEPFKVAPDFARVTRFALELSRLSDGAFDPTLGPLINLWGFGEKTGEHVVPTAEALPRRGPGLVGGT